MSHQIAFGPVPSRRLGQSLGVNKVMAKACSYTCVYCQVGPNTQKAVETPRFFSPEEIRAAVAAQLEKIPASGQRVVCLSFVPDGEPTLDSRLGESIEALRPLGIPISIITNGTLLWRDDGRLRRAALVCAKVDSVSHILRYLALDAGGGPIAPATAIGIQIYRTVAATEKTLSM